jgi:uncharacterized repeat protein (TIGR02543 family)
VKLYANWTPRTVEITYYSGSGDNSYGGTEIPGTSDNSKKYAETADLPAAPTLTGYTFIGWGTSPAGYNPPFNGTVADSTATSLALTIANGVVDYLYAPAAGNATLALYAKWAARSVDVTYDTNGGTGLAGETISGTYGGKIANAPTTQPSKTGYAFDGWYRDSLLTNAFTFGTAGTGTVLDTANGVTDFSPASDAGNASLTLYAKWDVNSYDVSYAYTGFVPAGAAAVPATVSHDYNTGVSVATAPNFSGYTFSGWTTSDASVSAGSFTMPAGAVAFTGSWTPNIYALSFDPNGGVAGTTLTKPVTYDAAVGTLPGTGSGAPTRVNYTFIGWSAVSGAANTADFTEAYIVDFTAAKTVYAVWQANPLYTVSYVSGADGVSGLPAGASLHAGDSYTVSAAVPARLGHTFNGWASSAGGTYSGGNTFSMPASDVVLTAQWTANYFSVSYAAGGDRVSGLPGGETILAETTYTVSQAVPSRLGYTFNGWSASIGGTYSGGNTFTMPFANVVLTAQWTPNNYTVSYAAGADGVSGLPGGATVRMGVNYTVSAAVPARAGYTFIGWSASVGGTYNAGGSFTMPAANVVLTAQWTLDETFTVTYNGNGNTGGSVPVDPAAYLSGATATVLGPNGLVRDGYKFAGWSTAAKGSGTNYSEGQSFTITANTTLYAQWTTDTKVVAGEGTPGSASGTDGTTGLTEGGNQTFSLFGNDVPLFGSTSSGTWALINLFLMIVGLVGALLTILPAVSRRRDDGRILLHIMTAVLAVAGIVLFALTEEIMKAGTSAVLFDQWSPLQAVLAVLALIIGKWATSIKFVQKESF